MSAYYNENNPFAAQWLKNLISAGLIANGDVDERGIEDVTKSDLIGYKQCHFFAGIGGWSYALRLAGWCDDDPVWTGSCPCQPFSRAGKKKGKTDERHLWPFWGNLIKEIMPSTVFGEQVESAIAHGWLDQVANDMEEYGYAFGASVIPACGVKSPQQGERLFFVGASEHYGLNGSSTFSSPSKAVFNNEEREIISIESAGAGSSRMLPFDGILWEKYPHGKLKAIKPGICLLADGIPSRVGKIRAYGNAIVPQVACEFIKSFMEIRG